MKLQSKSLIFGTLTAFVSGFLLNNSFIAPTLGLIMAFSFHLDMSWKHGVFYGFAVGVAASLYELLSKPEDIEPFSNFLFVGLILCIIYACIGAVFAKVFAKLLGLKNDSRKVR